MNNKLIGEKVRKVRGSMSLREFANKCDISHTYLDCIEKNYDPRTGKEVRITVETLEKLSKGTGYSIGELLNDSDRPVINRKVAPIIDSLERNSGDIEDLTSDEIEEIAKQMEFTIQYVKNKRNTSKTK